MEAERCSAKELSGHVQIKTESLLKRLSGGTWQDAWIDYNQHSGCLVFYGSPGKRDGREAGSRTDSDNGSSYEQTHAKKIISTSSISRVVRSNSEGDLLRLEIHRVNSKTLGVRFDTERELGHWHGFLDRLLMKTQMGPSNFCHLQHVTFNKEQGEFIGLPAEWERMLGESGLTRAEVAENPEAVLGALEIITDQQEKQPKAGGEPLGRAEDAKRRKREERQKLIDAAMGKLRNLVSSGDASSRFRFDRKLGQGASGTVYSALDRRTGQTVAIKRLLISQQPRLDMVAGELELMQALRGMPNVVRLLDAFFYNAEQELWLVMELVEGGALTGVIEEAIFTESQIARVCRVRPGADARAQHYPPGH